MVVKMFSVQDKKTGLFQSPFPAFNGGHAARLLYKQAKNPQGDFSMFPEDFSLYEVGEYDDQVGMVTCPAGKVTFVCAMQTVLELAQKKEVDG